MQASDNMTIIDHLGELRTRVLWVVAFLLLASLAAYYWIEPLLNWLMVPLAQLRTDPELMGKGLTVDQFIATEATEIFFVQLRYSFYFAMLITLPFFCMQVWLFISPGLYLSEKKAIGPFLLATPILFVLGGALAYYGILPYSMKVFLMYQQAGGEGILPVKLMPKISSYLSLAMSFIMAFGLCFQMPVLLLLLSKFGIVTASGLSSFRRFSYVIIFIVAAILTPPDVISQLLLAIPMVLLYEISFLLVWMRKKG